LLLDRLALVEQWTTQPQEAAPTGLEPGSCSVHCQR